MLRGKKRGGFGDKPRRGGRGGGSRGRGRFGSEGAPRDPTEPKKSKAVEFMTRYAASQRYSAVAPPVAVQKTGVFAPVKKDAVVSRTMQDIDVPGMRDPPFCTCWENPEAAGPWSSPEMWSSDMFAGIQGTAAMNGAKVAMCCKPQSEMGRDEHRMMHIALNNGEIRIDVPLVEGGDTPLYTQHWYCTTHRRFERKVAQSQKPPSPIVWTSCAADDN